jgi:hypothetical protein
MAAAVAILCGTAVVAAAERIGDFVIYDDVKDAIVLDGEIDPGTVRDFKRALKVRPNAKIVVLSSPGGYVDDALRLAADIHRRGMSTAIPKGFGCYSACAYLFFAGREHVVQGELGVHQVSAEGYTGGRDVYDGDVRQQLQSYGTPREVIRIMVATPPTDMYIFSRKEVARMAINRSSGKGSMAEKFAAR